MGCTTSSSVQEQSEASKGIPTRQTRILQEEEVDVYINDEYETVNNWEDLHGTFLTDKIEIVEVTGEWRSGMSAGGSRNDLELFSTNPQYLLALGPPDKHPKNDEFYLPNRNFTGTDVSVCLTQTTSSPPHYAAFFIYRTDNPSERLNAEYFLCMPSDGDTGAFVNWRQVHQRFRLTPGLYVLIPALFHSDKEGTFRLTVKAPEPVSLKALPSSEELLPPSNFQQHLIMEPEQNISQPNHQQELTISQSNSRT